MFWVLNKANMGSSLQQVLGIHLLKTTQLSVDKLRLFPESKSCYHMVVGILPAQTAKVKGSQSDRVLGFKLVHVAFRCNASGSGDSKGIIYRKAHFQGTEQLDRREKRREAHGQGYLHSHAE